jgi:spore maturation protein CgeB
MKTVLFNCPYLHGPGAIRWIVASWEEGFKRRGYSFHACDDVRLLSQLCQELQPDILYCDIVATPVEEEACRRLLQDVRRGGTKVCLSVFWPLVGQPQARAEALRRYDIADLYCGEREPDSMTAFERDTGKRYVTMPQSANPRYHFPVPADPRFNYDVVYLGAKLPNKRWFNENVLAPLRRRYRLGLFGPGWTLRDNTLRALSKGARMVHYRSLARWCDRFRFSISDEDEGKLYASAKIALNFHEREADNSQPHHIVNQRTFKIAACGGFQIADPVVALPKYFSADEIVTAGFDAREWIDKVDYYLRHEDERKTIQEQATARARHEHMAQHRVDLLERLLGLAPQG